jgi:hypothetical protein
LDRIVHRRLHDRVVEHRARQRPVDALRRKRIPLRDRIGMRRRRHTQINRCRKSCRTPQLGHVVFSLVSRSLLLFELRALGE